VQKHRGVAFEYPLSGSIILHWRKTNFPFHGKARILLRLKDPSYYGKVSILLIKTWGFCSRSRILLKRKQKHFWVSKILLIEDEGSFWWRMKDPPDKDLRILLVAEDPAYCWGSVILSRILLFVENPSYCWESFLLLRIILIVEDPSYCWGYFLLCRILPIQDQGFFLQKRGSFWDGIKDSSHNGRGSFLKKARIPLMKDHGSFSPNSEDPWGSYLWRSIHHLHGWGSFSYVSIGLLTVTKQSFPSWTLKLFPIFHRHDENTRVSRHIRNHLFLANHITKP
jgi:hypothetical protein